MSGLSFVGKLDDVSLAEILQNLYVNRTSGIIDLQKEKDQRRIFILYGEVKSAMSNIPGHRVGAYLVSTGKITSQQLDAAVRDVTHGGRLGQKLVHLGFLSAQDLDAGLKELVMSMVQEAMGWFQGLYRLTVKDAPVPQDIMLAIPTVSLIFHGTTAYASPSFVQARLPLHAILKPTARIKEYYSQLTLNPNQAYLLTLVDGRMPVDQILSVAPGNSEENLVALYAFNAAGLVATGDEDKPLSTKEFFDRFQDRATASTPAKPAGKKRRKIKWIRPKPIIVEYSADDIRKIRNKIQKVYSQLNQYSHYDILELPPRTTQKEIHYAFMALCQFYDSEVMGALPAFADLAGLMETIYERMEDAYLTLIDVKKRAEYDRRWARSNY